ncbi:translation elongation factor EF-Ts [Deinococcus metalli]|uniref:Translation elongation factor EF-Ts n=1 Tax=Deinococcus metalli TaxID=1141878 RepID=A0A7W8KIU0_9DEIO|nr:hypothetical protein [Deinococcus metalli]MBB5378902.1 translation elongation factor EF-Ts [Deinococcus metalli]GHF62611.1 hypothetical protein GCM10017781_43290 [Deinococcus metalli]
MRALDTIAESIRIGYVHPTKVLNTLIEVENEGGLGAVRRIERHLSLGATALRDRQHPNSDTAQQWLNSTRAYLITQAERKQAV